MTTRVVRALLAAAAMLVTDGALAQSMDYESLEQLFGEPVTTSATGTPLRESRVPATMEIITATEIRRSGARDIPGVLRHVVGIDVLQWGSDHSDVAIRGYNQSFSPRLLVLINGRQVYAEFYGFTQWSTLPVELAAIRQIEVVKGPNCALFGFNAVGGVINIVTYDPLYDEVREAAVSGGTQQLRQLSAVGTARLGAKAALLINAGLRRNDDFALPPGLSENYRDALALDLRWRPAEKVHAGVEATYSRAGELEIGPTYAVHYPDVETRSIKGHVAADTDYGLIRATVYFNDIESDVMVLDGFTPNLLINNHLRVMQLQDLFKVGADHTFRVAIEQRHSDMETTPVAGGKVFYDVLSSSGMWSWNASPTISWTNAVRVDRFSMGRSGSVPPGYGLTNEDWDRSFTETSFNTGLVWVLGDTDSVRFTIGRGVQLPSLNSLGGFVLAIPSVGYVGGNPDMNPSVVTNYEVGWDRDLAALGADLSVNVYRSQTRDLAAFLGGSDFAVGLVSTSANIGNSRTTGVEVAIDAVAGPNWLWGAGYAYQTIRDRFSAGFTVENTLVNFEDTLPRHVLLGRLGWAQGPWEIDGWLRYQSATEGVGPASPWFGQLVPIPAWVSVDGRLAYRVTPRATLALAVQNLNRSKQQRTSAGEVERSVVASLTVAF